MKDDQVEDYPFSFYTEKDVRICFYFKFLKVINIIHIYRSIALTKAQTMLYSD